MGYVYYNPNPKALRVGDCTVRAISKLLSQDWETTYIQLCLQGLEMNDMPSSNNVWSSFLMSKGYQRYIILDSCPNCYTVKDFCIDHPTGDYLLCTGTHVVAVMDGGNYFDTWDSGDEVPMFYFRKE